MSKTQNCVNNDMYWLGVFKVNVFEIFLLYHHHVCLNSEKSLYLYINNGLFLYDLLLREMF